MRRRAGILATALAVVAAAAAAVAEEVVLGLSQDAVAITATFDGSDILIFGAVKREVPIPDGPPLDVIITVAGPLEPVEIRRKARRFGIWVNSAAISVSRAPSFYAVASNRPVGEILSYTEDLRHSITIPRAIRTIGATGGAPDVDNFVDALIRIRLRQNLYQKLEGDVTVDQQTLFRVSVDLPANLTEGPYPTRIFLLRDGRVVSGYETVIDVRKVGLERLLYNLAHEQPLVYGLLSLVIAVAAGWAASAAFRLLRS